MEQYSWIGSEKHYVDEMNRENLGQICIGRFGGNSSAGQWKNEDALLIWADSKKEWELVMLMDAHDSSESADLLMKEIDSLKDAVSAVLNRPVEYNTFQLIDEIILNCFQKEEFQRKCQQVNGETAYLCVIRKDKYVHWLSIGDCAFYLFHSELMRLGESMQNQRSFFEWIGRRNTFSLAVPCYSTGTKELRKGTNHLFMTTDGLLECPNTDFASGANLYKSFQNKSLEQGVTHLLEEIKNNHVRGSTTIITWLVEVSEDATRPSDEVTLG